MKQDMREKIDFLSLFKSVFSSISISSALRTPPPPPARDDDDDDDDETDHFGPLTKREQPPILSAARSCSHTPHTHYSFSLIIHNSREEECAAQPLQ